MSKTMHRKATAAALEMREALEELNKHSGRRTLTNSYRSSESIQDRVLSVTLGSSTRFDYSVLGDAVNLAARLESACKKYDADLIIS